MEEIPHVVEAREVDMAVLLPLVLLPLDRVPLIEVAVGGLLPLHRLRHRHRRRRWLAGSLAPRGFNSGYGSAFSPLLPPARPNLSAEIVW